MGSGKAEKVFDQIKNKLRHKKAWATTEAIEELIVQRKSHRTVVLVTHNLGQARRVADSVACLDLRDGMGQVVECGHCEEVLRK